jgi:hypothetical protein
MGEIIFICSIIVGIIGYAGVGVCKCHDVFDGKQDFLDYVMFSVFWPIIIIFYYTFKGSQKCRVLKNQKNRETETRTALLRKKPTTSPPDPNPLAKVGKMTDLRGLAAMLVCAVALAPYEQIAQTLEQELVLRSAIGVLLAISIRRMLNNLAFLTITACEAAAIGYNLAIAFGYFVTDAAGADVYAHTMLALFVVQLAAILFGRRRERRSDSNFNHRAAPGSNSDNAGKSGQARI